MPFGGRGPGREVLGQLKTQSVTRRVRRLTGRVDMGLFGRSSSSGSNDKDKPKPAEGHDKNARPSTKGKHERGDQRRGKDKQGEKGDARRRGNPNKNGNPKGGKGKGKG